MATSKLCMALLVIASTSANIREYTMDGFTAMVQENMLEASAYVLPKDNSKIATTEDETITDYGYCDFIVVGAGSAGTLLTRRLTEVSEFKTLLLEAGGDETDFSDIPAMAPFLQNSDMNWGYFTVPQKTCCQGMVNNSCIAPRGKVLGGSSTINAKMYVRGNREDYDGWARMGNGGWSFQEVFPYFLKTEDLLTPDGDPGYHQAGGEGILPVDKVEANIFTKLYFDGMDELGYEEKDYNGRDQFGYSTIYSTFRKVGISSGGRVFIDPIRHRSNLNLTLNAFVTKVIINDAYRAIGVEFIKAGKRYRAYATKEVILSAGSINSAQILMLSGIGPRKELEKFGIDVIRDLPVGQNMQDHPDFVGIFIKTNLTQYDISLIQSCERYLQHQPPLTASFGADSTAFLKVDNSTPFPDIQHIIVVPSAVGVDPGRFLNLKPEISAHLLAQFSPSSDMSFHLILLHEKSRGSVTLQSNDPVDFPLISYNYFSDPLGEDIETMYQGVRLTLELLETEAFRAVDASLISFVPACEIHQSNSREYWYCVIRALTTTVYHPVGSTRMGKCNRTSVVDSKLRVHGIKRLRVVDAGVFPEITSGNTNAPTYMIAEKAADIIKYRYGVL